MVQRRAAFLEAGRLEPTVCASTDSTTQEVAVLSRRRDEPPCAEALRRLDQRADLRKRGLEFARPAFADVEDRVFER